MQKMYDSPYVKGEVIRMCKVACFVPIKLNSERVPGKNIKKFHDGTALITHALKTLVKVNGIDELYVFCSNEEIKKYLIDGVEFLERPSFLDTNEATPQNIIDEFMKRVNADVYMVSHVTSPFVKKEHFEECIQAVKNDGFDSAFTAEKVQRLFWTKEMKPLNFDPCNVPRTQELEPIYSEVSAAYVFRKETFLKYRRRIGENPYIVEVDGIESIDIDNPEDFDMASAVYKEILGNKDA